MAPRYARCVSPRTRARILVGLAACAAAALVVGVTVLQADDSRTEAGAPQPPPLELGLVLRDDPEARALREAERRFELGEREEALRRFESILRRNRDSVEAAVGVAIAAWPEGTVERLDALVQEYPANGVARLHLGFALLTAGDGSGARQEWRETVKRDPDSPAALRAEDVLHPEMAPGRPPFVAELSLPSGLDELPPERQLGELERRAEAGGAVEEWLALGVALQRAGRPVSAGEAFEHALEIDPASLPAQVAAAVGRFDKDEPARAFSRLGPLASEHPRAGIVRYHLGLCLSWIGAVEEARRQLEAAAGTEGFYGREAGRLLARLEAVGT